MLLDFLAEVTDNMGDFIEGRAYVLTAARNAALNLLPSRKIWNEVIDIEEVKVADKGDLFEQVALSQDSDLLLRAARQLPEPYQDVLMLYFSRN